MTKRNAMVAIWSKQLNNCSGNAWSNFPLGCPQSLENILWCNSSKMALSIFTAILLLKYFLCLAYLWWAESYYGALLPWWSFPLLVSSQVLMVSSFFSTELLKGSTRNLEAGRLQSEWFTAGGRRRLKWVQRIVLWTFRDFRIKEKWTDQFSP